MFLWDKRTKTDLFFEIFLVIYFSLLLTHSLTVDCLINRFLVFFIVVVLYGANSGSLGRRLLSSNSTSHGPVWEDCSWERDRVPGIWICIHFIGILIIFIGKYKWDFKRFSRELVLVGRQLILLFWTSCDVSPGFQSEDGSPRLQRILIATGLLLPKACCYCTTIPWAMGEN